MMVRARRRVNRRAGAAPPSGGGGPQHGRREHESDRGQSRADPERDVVSPGQRGGRRPSGGEQAPRPGGGERGQHRHAERGPDLLGRVHQA
jgi:hypothetical protein